MADQDDEVDQNDPDDGGYPLMPPDPDLANYRPSMPPIRPEPEPETESPGPERFQFSLAELLLLMTAASVVFAVLSMLPRQWRYASGLAGLAVLISMILMEVYQPTRAIIRLGWWVLLGIYLLSCIVAMVGAG